LEYYGYVAGGGSKNLNDALQKFQADWGLKPDGVLGPITQEFISRPRSANSDLNDKTEGVLLTQLKKGKYRLTYTVSEVDDDLVDITLRDYGLSKLQKVLNAAFTSWTKPLSEKLGKQVSFEYVEPDHKEVIDLEIRWELFDGIGGTLGFASSEKGLARCSIQLDRSERWTLDNNLQYSVQPVVTHEIGHLFGLTHENKEDTVMFPYYRPTFLAPTARDIEAVAKRALEKLPAKQKTSSSKNN